MQRIKQSMKNNARQETGYFIKQYEHKGTITGRGVLGNDSYFWISNNHNITANTTVYLPNTPQEYTISSDSTNDTGNIVISGLGEYFRELTEELTLDGSNTVNLTNEYTRINKIEYIPASNVSTFTHPLRNEGNISVINSSNIIITSILQDEGVSRNGLYTVPAGEKIYLNDVIHNSQHNKGNDHSCTYEIIKIKHDNTYPEDYKNETVYISDEENITNKVNIIINGKESVICFARPDTTSSGIYSMSINYTVNA